MNAMQNTTAPADSKTDTLGLSDTELDNMSGGVSGTTVMVSIFTLGIGCGVVSITVASHGMDCGEVLSR